MDENTTPTPETVEEMPVVEAPVVEEPAVEVAMPAAEGDVVVTDGETTVVVEGSEG